MKRLLSVFSVFLTCFVFTLMSAMAMAAETEAPAPLPPLEAARSMKVPSGFQVTLFAGEPDVRQPIGFCIDDRGRLWVAEAYNYPHHGTKPGDRILIFEDADGDGRFDRRTVFYDKLNYVTGIEVGFGGVWVMSPPSLFFIPDGDGDDRPDAEPQTLLDGFGNHANSHNLANGFAWGPDGWLYGTHGRTNWSLIGKPGTPEKDRVRFDGGVYRYHPVRHVWEPFADGTTNPWGIDWDDFGQAFVCNCVNPHLFHVIQGAHYEPWRNRESSRYAYERIDTIADHLHYTGGGNVRAGIGSEAENQVGGGHAHCGTMVYLGDNWPARYRNTVFTNNIHGRRINNDPLRRVGSGYVATHASDLMISADPWFMGVTLAYGPDGAVYASDWSDTGECHSVRNTQRETGRIFKITYGEPKPRKTNLAAMSNAQLADLQTHKNDWQVRHARRLLQERAAAGQAMSEVHQKLHLQFKGEGGDSQAEIALRLRALWALWAIEALDGPWLLDQLNDENEYIRAWVVRLLCERGTPAPAVLAKFAAMAKADDSSFVRLHLASALQQLDHGKRWEIAANLASHGEDAADQNLPLMIWYGIQPLVETDVARFVQLARTAQIPLVRKHIARRAASLREAEPALDALAGLLATSTDKPLSRDLLTGMLQGLEGRRSVPMPRLWREAREQLETKGDEPIQDMARQLALIFDDPIALAQLRSQAVDAQASPRAREQAISALAAKRDGQLPALLLKQLNDTGVQRLAIRTLAQFDDPAIAPALLKHYSQFELAARRDAIETLASRALWAGLLLEAVDRGKIPRTDLSAFTARQIASLNDPATTAKLQSVWGEVRNTPEDKAKLIANHKRRYTPDVLARADRAAGRLVFEKTCASCHRLFGSGQTLGPDLTGAQRNNLDYLLQNLIDPSAAVSKDFQMQVIVTESGRVVTGLIMAQNDNALTIQTATESLVIPLGEVESRGESNVSMMPDGMLQQLSPRQLADLLAYLSGSTQIPLPATDD